ncbi:unnamed protein product [Lupinus luteus]|uniref:Uncharacterized protein n=1 Tax=Lupinus luteus TaxID=3873 RepID=A0AAV1W357_LUPLU
MPATFKRAIRRLYGTRGWGPRVLCKSFQCQRRNNLGFNTQCEEIVDGIHEFGGNRGPHPRFPSKLLIIDTKPYFDLDIKEDVEEECSKYGRIKHIYSLQTKAMRE